MNQRQKEKIQRNGVGGQLRKAPSLKKKQERGSAGGVCNHRKKEGPLRFADLYEKKVNLKAEVGLENDAQRGKTR